MPKKGFLKKKKFQRICREMARRGMISDASGKFTPASSKTIDQMYLAGYRVK